MTHLIDDLKKSILSYDKHITWLEKQGENKFGQREECLDCQFNYSGECKGSCAMKKGEQKEYTFKSIPRLLDMIEPSDRAKAYCQKLIDTLTKEGYNIDAKIAEGVLKGWNGEDVPMAVMDEQKPQGKSALEAIKEEKADNANKIEPKDYSSIDPYFGKPINNVEPKFHEGDLITDGYNIFYVDKIKEDKYFGIYLTDKSDETIDGKISFKGEKYYHHLTIKDLIKRYARKL